MLAVGQRERLWRSNAGKWFNVPSPCPACRAKGRWIQGAPAGSADLTGILSDGRRLEIEVKSARGVQSDDQRNWQRMIEGRGGIYVLARSVEDVLDALG